MVCATRLCLMVLLFTVSACGAQNKLSDDLDEYRQRLANVLDVDKAKVLTPTPLKLPPLSNLRPEIPAMTMEMSDFYALQDCPVNTLIAERNTSLGRIQHPSARFSYEVELLEALRQCELNDDQSMNATLAEWLAQKQAQLPYVWSDLVAGSDEIYLAMTRSTGYIRGDEQDGLATTRSALSYIAELAKQPVSDNEILEQHLQNLMEFRLPARVWRSQRLAEVYLNSLTAWLVENQSLLQCQNGKAERRTQYLVNVFNLFFIDRLQPLLSQLNKYHYELAPLLNELSGHPALPEGLVSYISTNTGDSFEGYQSAVQQHIAWWQSTFKRCGIRPGKAIQS